MANIEVDFAKYMPSKFDFARYYSCLLGKDFDFSVKLCSDEISLDTYVSYAIKYYNYFI